MHRPTTLFLVIAALALLGGCRTYSGQFFIGSADYELADVVSPDGTRTVFRVRVAAGAGLQAEHTRMIERPALGIDLVELDKPRAEARGVKPYSGLLVTRVRPDSSGAAAGLLTGDVLLALDGTELVYAAQYQAAEAVLRPDQVVQAGVLRGQERIDLTLAARLVREEVATTEAVPLDAPPATFPPYAGVTLRGIPRAWTARIFGEPREAVLVANVEVGSPAWLAGVRSGDLIDQVDGEPVPPASELSARIVERGVMRQTMNWRVRRGAGQVHDAVLELRDYSGETRLNIPLLLRVTNGTYEDHWDVLLGLLASNRNTYIANTASRRTETQNVFSLLLGLFRVDSGPRSTSVRILWLIKFET